MTDANPTPFRRFPWVQLVFCLACLSMATWTWMRFSYRWDTTVVDLDQKLSGISMGWPEMAYIRLDGDMDMIYVRVRGQDERQLRYDPLRQVYTKAKDTPHASVYSLRHVIVKDAPLAPRFVDVESIPEEMSEAGRKKIVVGRPIYEDAQFKYLDTTASRWTPQTIASLIVGAMGCFIFGLYLRRWLRERRVLARQSEQDMSA